MGMALYSSGWSVQLTLAIRQHAQDADLVTVSQQESEFADCVKGLPNPLLAVRLGPRHPPGRYSHGYLTVSFSRNPGRHASFSSPRPALFS